MNKDLFDVLVKTKENIGDKLNNDSKRYLDRLILERKLDGLHLDEETRKKTKELKEKISDLCLEYSKNCNEEATKLHFTAEQLSK
jgi:Zn-dependent oligopeptidase